MNDLLNENETKELLNTLSKKWSISDKFLVSNYKFKSFQNAINFINEVGKTCEDMNHHPKWTNTYDMIEIELYTHDKNGLTKKDFALAKRMDEVFKDLN